MKTAMILAAGRGERLKPLTNHIPKAMSLVNGIPLIEYHIIKLVAAGFHRIIINHAWLGGQIRQHVGHGEKWQVEICFSAEPPGGLETGGGIVQALPLLGQEPFLTVNADIFTSFPFAKLSLPTTSLAHLVLITNPEHKTQGDFGLKQSILSNENAQYTISGIACYHPDAFRGTLPGRYSVTPLLRQLANQQLASGELFTGDWSDIGTLPRLSAINSAVNP